MNNLKKIGLTALGTALISSTASVAGDMSVTGTALINFAGNNNTNTGNGWSMSDTMTFSGSGDLDNGMSITYGYTMANAVFSSSKLLLDMGD